MGGLAGSRTELIKVDGNGNTIWERRQFILGNKAEILSLHQISSGYFISGTAYVNSYPRVFFSRLDDQGFINYEHIFENSAIEALRGANVLPGNRFIFSSLFIPQGDTVYWNTRITDYDGNILRQKSFGTIGYISMPSILPLQNSDILFAGMLNPLHGMFNDQVFVVRTDSNLYSKPLSVNQSNEFIASDFHLHQNYPNPFNPSTTITFELSKSSFIELKLFDINGKYIETIASGKYHEGDHEKVFNADGLASGIYYYVLKSGENVVTKKMIFLK